MAGKKKSPKASSKKPVNAKNVVTDSDKIDDVKAQDLATSKVDKAEKSKQTKDVAKASKASSKKSDKSKSEKDKGEKTAGKKVKNFFKDFRGEVKKVTWNSKEDTMKSTAVVLLVVLIVGIGIWIVDFGLTSLRESLYTLSKSNPQEARMFISMMLSGLM